MKSLNDTSTLWTTLSAGDVETADYQAACCLNIKITKSPSPQVTSAAEAVTPTHDVTLHLDPSVLSSTTSSEPPKTS